VSRQDCLLSQALLDSETSSAFRSFIYTSAEAPRSPSRNSLRTRSHVRKMRDAVSIAATSDLLVDEEDTLMREPPAPWCGFSSNEMERAATLTSNAICIITNAIIIPQSTHRSLQRALQRHRRRSCSCICHIYRPPPQLSLMQWPVLLCRVSARECACCVLCRVISAVSPTPACLACRQIHARDRATEIIVDLYNVRRARLC